MKKVLLSLAVAFGMIASANAQLVVGGGLNFGGWSDKQSTTSAPGGDTFKRSSFQFGFTPKVGYLINEKLEVGAGIGLNYSETMFYTQIYDITDPANPGKGKSVKNRKDPEFSWAIKPYARYRFFEVSGFGFWLEGVVSLGTSIEGRPKYYAYGSATEVDATAQWRSADDAKKMNEVPAGHKYSKFNGSFKVQPVITYTINEHWVLDLQLELLSLNIGGSVEKTTDDDGTGTKVTDTENEFNWGLGLKQNQGIAFGVSYKF